MHSMPNTIQELVSIIFNRTAETITVGEIKVKMSNALDLDKVVIFLSLSSFLANSMFFKCSLSLFAAVIDNIQVIIKILKLVMYNMLYN